MTKTHTTYTVDAVYAMQQSNIQHVANLLKAEYLGTPWLPKSDVEFFIHRIHEDAPYVLLSLLESSWDDDDAIRALLHRYFARALNDLRKRVRTELKHNIKGESAEILIGNSCYEKGSYDTSTRKELREVLVQALVDAHPDVSALCLAFLKYETWIDAGESLGWDPYKVWRVSVKAKKFFKKNYVNRAGLLELNPCKDRDTATQRHK